ncbi:MAG: hypothetical protein OXC01_02715 [Immundisolibacterales bacterium]|nr:hypothetical protein [Immundisolibacterales bacterium]
MSKAAFEISEIMRTVRRSLPMENLALPDRFFPAHLSVALIDAIFRTRCEYDDHTVPAARRYCRHFDIAQSRVNRWTPPEASEQEALTDLIRHFETLGMDRMIGEVFRTEQTFLGTKRPKAEYVLRTARELKRIGIEVLQDVQVRSCEEIEQVLEDSAGLGAATIRMVLMYTGNDEFVRGDGHVRRFVADALGREGISAGRAESLVRRCAHELILSPRYLDHQIWSRSSTSLLAA